MIGFVENTLKRELPLPEPKPVVKRTDVVEKPKIEIVEKPKPVDLPKQIIEQPKPVDQPEPVDVKPIPKPAPIVNLPEPDPIDPFMKAPFNEKPIEAIPE